MRRPVVAAVCYRRLNNGIEFLLVHTTGGAYWTFPKGHVDPGEENVPWQSAAREALEEAGALGVVEHEPFVRYAYYRHDLEMEGAVDAYLLEVEAQQEPEEPQRRPQWFAAEEANARLAENRDEKYAAEHEKVIRAALQKLVSH